MEKKKKEEKQKPLFEVWLEAYNSRLVEVCTPKARAQKKPSEGDSESEPPSSTKT
jgi:hypothetical protein